MAHEKSPCRGADWTFHSGPTPPAALQAQASNPMRVKMNPKDETMKGIWSLSGGKIIMERKKT